MGNPIAVWHSEHYYFRQLLLLLEQQVDMFHRGEEPPYEVMADIISYLSEYTDQNHHPREDVAFARLAQYCPNLELVLTRLQQEHRVIAHTGKELLEQLQAVLGGAIVPREELEAAAAMYLVYYNSHLNKEDTTIVAAAAQHLTAEDWQAVKKAVPLNQDPLFGTSPRARYNALREQLTCHNTPAFQGLTAVH